MPALTIRTYPSKVVHVILVQNEANAQVALDAMCYNRLTGALYGLESDTSRILLLRAPDRGLAGHRTILSGYIGTTYVLAAHTVTTNQNPPEVGPRMREKLTVKEAGDMAIVRSEDGVRVTVYALDANRQRAMGMMNLSPRNGPPHERPFSDAILDIATNPRTGLTAVLEFDMSLAMSRLVVSDFMLLTRTQGRTLRNRSPDEIPGFAKTHVAIDTLTDQIFVLHSTEDWLRFAVSTYDSNGNQTSLAVVLPTGPHDPRVPSRDSSPLVSNFFVQGRMIFIVHERHILIYRVHHNGRISRLTPWFLGTSANPDLIRAFCVTAQLGDISGLAHFAVQVSTELFGSRMNALFLVTIPDPFVEPDHMIQSALQLIADDPSPQLVPAQEPARGRRVPLPRIVRRTRINPAAPVPPPVAAFLPRAEPDRITIPYDSAINLIPTLQRPAPLADGTPQTMVTIPYDEAQRQWEARLRASRSQDGVWPTDFFDMKKSEQIRSITREPFFLEPERCPLFNKYDKPRYLGAGGYGVVIRTFRKSGGAAAAPVEQYAVKFQRIEAKSITDHRMGPYVELRILHAINSLIAHWPSHTRKYPCGFVRLLDWVRCKLNLREVVFPLLALEDRPRAENKFEPSEQLYQIMVLEFADGGTLSDMMRGERIVAIRMCEPRVFRSMFLQIFGPLWALGHTMLLTLHDCKTDNILVSSIPLRMPITTLKYRVGQSQYMYLDTSDTLGMQFLLSDFGLTRAIINNVSVYSRVAGTRVFNQRSDTELFAVTFLRDLIVGLSNDIRSLHPRANPRVLAPEVISVLRRCMHYQTQEESKAIHALGDNIWNLEKVRDEDQGDANYYRDYAIMDIFLSWLAGNYSIETTMPEMVAASGDVRQQDRVWRLATQRMHKVFTNIYLVHRVKWIETQHINDVKCIGDLFRDRLFSDLRMNDDEVAQRRSLGEMRAIHEVTNYGPPGAPIPE
jgi:hypothetical protein